MSIGENIRKLRLSHGLNQAELGKIAGVSDKAVSTWENGLKTPRMASIQRLAEHFHLTKSEILDDEPRPAPTQERELGLDDFEYALLNETRELPAEKQKMLLEMARFMRADLEKEG